MSTPANKDTELQARDDWACSCWYLEDEACPVCGGMLATNSRLVWCTVDACSYSYRPEWAELAQHEQSDWDGEGLA